METVVRVAIIYLFLMVGLRILGKREFSQMSALEVVTLMMIPELVSAAVQRESASMTNAFIGITTLFSLVFLTSVLMHMTEKAEKVISGTPKVLVHHGQLVPDHLNKERVTPEEVYDAMHVAGLDDLANVKWAILETDGNISIVPEEWPQGPVHQAAVTQHKGSVS